VLPLITPGPATLLFEGANEEKPQIQSRSQSAITTERTVVAGGDRGLS